MIKSLRKFSNFPTFNNLASTEIFYVQLCLPPIIYEYYHPHAFSSHNNNNFLHLEQKITEASSDKHLSSVKLKCSNGLKLILKLLFVYSQKRAATSHANIEIYFENFCSFKIIFFTALEKEFFFSILLTFTHNLAKCL